MTSRLKMVAALAEVALSEERAARVMKTEYPIGASIEWERGGHVQTGTIEGTNFHHDPHFRVRNARTGKVYWITFYDVICAAGWQAKDHYFEAREKARKAA